MSWTRKWNDKGYGFVPIYQKGVKGQYQLIVEKSRWKQLKAKLKEETQKTTPMTFDERVQKIKAIQRGWINNFRLANILGKLKDLDGWLRNRLRYCIWSRLRRDGVRGAPVGFCSPAVYSIVLSCFT